MATNTTNFSLVKPAYSDTADIADINGNMDKVDVSLNGLADAIAIVANNNTHAAITAGQYVYVHGHGTLAEGLYTAKSNIAADATLSTSNLQADESGGLNSVYSTLNSNKQNAAAFYPKVTITGATQSDFDAALNAQLAPMNEQTAIFVILNGSGATVKPTYGSRCLGILYKRNSTYSGCLCVGFNSSQMLANGVCSNGTWTWDVPASNSKISTIKTLEVTHGTINAGVSSTIEISITKRMYIIGYSVSGTYNSDCIPWSYYCTNTAFVSRVKNTGSNNASNIAVTYQYFEME